MRNHTGLQGLETNARSCIAMHRHERQVDTSRKRVAPIVPQSRVSSGTVLSSPSVWQCVTQSARLFPEAGLEYTRGSRQVGADIWDETGLSPEPGARGARPTLFAITVVGRATRDANERERRERKRGRKRERKTRRARQLTPDTPWDTGSLSAAKRGSGPTGSTGSLRPLPAERAAEKRRDGYKRPRMGEEDEQACAARRRQRDGGRGGG